MLLAIDTATRMLSLALHSGDALLAEKSWATASNHTVELSPAIASLLAQVRGHPSDLSALAVALGPGSFTGLRIGMSVAKGLALTADPPLPLVGIPTLDSTAAAQPPLTEHLIAVSRAGRGRINGCRYTWRADRWVADDDVFLTDWDSLTDTIETDTLIAGEIEADERRQLEASGRPVRLSSPALSLRRAGVLAELAYQRLRDDSSYDAALLAPIYLHT